QAPAVDTAGLCPRLRGAVGKRGVRLQNHRLLRPRTRALHSVERCRAWHPLAGGRADLVSQRPGRRAAGACRSLRPTPATVEKRHCRLRLAMPCGACHVALGVAALPAVPMLAFCRLLLFTTALFCGLATAADPNSVDPGGRQLDADQLALINRITWGATPQVVQTFLRAGH